MKNIKQTELNFVSAGNGVPMAVAAFLWAIKDLVVSSKKK